MDIDFMSDYYNSKYEDPVEEICADDNKFYKIRRRFVCQTLYFPSDQLHLQGQPGRRPIHIRDIRD